MHSLELERAYEIGRFIASMVPYLDEVKREGCPWASHRECFQNGPNPLFIQMKQGVMVAVEKANSAPSSLYTRYGEWTVLGTVKGDFKEVFEVVKRALNLIEIKDFEDVSTSYWAVPEWQGVTLEKPVQARQRNEYIQPEVAFEEICQFKANAPFVAVKSFEEFIEK